MATPKKSKGKKEVEQFFDDLHPEQTQSLERPKNLKIVSSGDSFHKFDEKPIFQGYLVGEYKAKKDNPKYKTKAGDTIGFSMIEKGTEKPTVIKNSWQIADAFRQDNYNKKTLWWIEFEEKVVVNKKPLNKFLIGKQN